MKENWKIAGMSVGMFVGLILLVFILGGIGLGYKAFFAPKHAAVDRLVFEETQSFVHGKVQDLAKYKREYDAMTSLNDQQALRAVIGQQFAQFNKSKVVDPGLRQFLVNMRGF